jgi:hypothetical protein
MGARIESRLVWIAVVALAFALVSHRILGQGSGFIFANALIGGLCLVAAAGLALGRVAAPPPSSLRGPFLDNLLRSVSTIWLIALVFSLSVVSGVRFDWTFEGEFELAEATQTLLGEVHEGDRACVTLYYDDGDPRIRNTRVLLEQFTQGHPIELRVRELSRYPDDEDRFGIGSSNSVVIELGDRWQLVPRPTEGGLYEGFASLLHDHGQVIYATFGAGEGDLGRFDDGGYSGLRAALELEGYELRPLPLAIAERVPADAAALLILAPERPLTSGGQTALRDYLEGGGRAVVFLDDEVQPSLEALLAEFGIVAQPGLVVDPPSGSVEGDTPGANPVAFNYGEHPVTHGLGANRMTFFGRTRGFALRKTSPGQHLRPLVHASGEAWIDTALSPDASRLPPVRPDAARTDYWPLVVASETDEDGRSTRIVAFGDAELASNHALRALYNLDLVLNAVHWTTEREESISVRPKTGARRLNQFPVPLESSLQALYGVGMVVPELLLLAAGWVWLRQRSA